MRAEMRDLHTHAGSGRSTCARRPSWPARPRARRGPVKIGALSRVEKYRVRVATSESFTRPYLRLILIKPRLPGRRREPLRAGIKVSECGWELV